MCLEAKESHSKHNNVSRISMRKVVMASMKLNGVIEALTKEITCHTT